MLRCRSVIVAAAVGGIVALGCVSGRGVSTEVARASPSERERPYQPRMGTLGHSPNPLLRGEYRAGFEACARAVRRGALPRLYQVRAPTRVEAAFRLLARARPFVRAVARPFYAREKLRYPQLQLRYVIRVAMKGCSDALEIGAVRRPRQSLYRLPVRVLERRNPRIVVYGTPKLQLAPRQVELIVASNRDPKFLTVTQIAALPSKYRKNEYLHTKSGLGEARGPIWVVLGRTRSSNECTDVAPNAKCPPNLTGPGYVVIEDRSHRIVESASGPGAPEPYPQGSAGHP